MLSWKRIQSDADFFFFCKSIFLLSTGDLPLIVANVNMFELSNRRDLSGAEMNRRNPKSRVPPGFPVWPFEKWEKARKSPELIWMIFKNYGTWPRMAAM